MRTRMRGATLLPSRGMPQTERAKKEETRFSSAQISAENDAAR